MLDCGRGASDERELILTVVVVVLVVEMVAVSGLAAAIMGLMVRGLINGSVDAIVFEVFQVVSC